MEKTIRKYGKVYRKALLFRHCRDIEAKAVAYEARLWEMYASDGFKAHSVYPTTNATHVYAVIAMCLELGYLSGMMRISRGQYADHTDLKVGFQKFWPLVRLTLLQYLIYLAVGILAVQIASIIFNLN